MILSFSENQFNARLTFFKLILIFAIFVSNSRNLQRATINSQQ